ncbi:transmembrane protein 100 [Hypomesus transpacificus]|uniref:transmembrane protein 100 n=1 Tax=Hypomesus transpacificus TaxID=137520 RepID=UPI001F081B60|nr:transmembrane protein 100 [Hypomesus transpacificus]
MCCQRDSRQSTERQPEWEGEKGRVPELKLTTEDTAAGSPRSSGPPVQSLEPPAPGGSRMGCTTGHLACQPQPQANPGQEALSLEAGGPKVPEVLSSLERLSQATGGMEKSWYRCIFPFGIISLVIGVSGTGVTYTYNDLPQTKVVSVVLLVVGLVLVLMATACWSVHKKKKRKKKEGGSFTSEQCPL